ncbi:MAG: TfoX/Sxy family protein [Gemmataceae bacterium]|nr:TfoX/Sxy family protein [Gemmataceae bacterium]
MAFDDALGERIRTLLRKTADIAEKKMFGSLVFLHRGNMIVGIWKKSLIARPGPQAGEQSLLMPHVRPFDVTGKPMKGWVMVHPEGLATDADLALWIEQSLAFVETLDAKTG